jgi:hypothetical protein
MKRKIIIACISCLILIASSVKAQSRPPRRDTVWGAWSNQEYYNSILSAPVATGETQPVNIIPNQTPFCFDKKITVKSTVGRTVIEQCLYLDTKGGLVGFIKATGYSSNNMCTIRPDDEDFNFSVIGLKGNAYLYSNTKKKNIIQHWVSTGNTQTYAIQANSNTGTYSLKNKQISKSYCNEKIKATAYKFDSPNSPLLYLFGKTYPPTLNVTTNKYIGNFGIGYQYTDRGLYIIMETKSSRFACEITSIEDVNTCFDPSLFRIKEDDFVVKERENIIKEKEKIDRDEARIRADDVCAASERNILVFKKAQIRIKEQNLQGMTQGNLIQNQQAQMATLNLMNPLFMVQGDILYTLHSICLTEAAIRERPAENGNAEKLSCLQTYLRKLYSAETQMSELDVLYARDPGKGYYEKSRVYRELMLRACN